MLQTLVTSSHRPRSRGRRKFFVYSAVRLFYVFTRKINYRWKWNYGNELQLFNVIGKRYLDNVRGGTERQSRAASRSSIGSPSLSAVTFRQLNGSGLHHPSTKRHKFLLVVPILYRSRLARRSDRYRFNNESLRA